MIVTNGSNLSSKMFCQSLIVYEIPGAMYAIELRLAWFINILLLVQKFFSVLLLQVFVDLEMDHV